MSTPAVHVITFRPGHLVRPDATPAWYTVEAVVEWLSGFPDYAVVIDDGDMDALEAALAADGRFRSDRTDVSRPAWLYRRRRVLR